MSNIKIDILNEITASTRRDDKGQSVWTIETVVGLAYNYKKKKARQIFKYPNRKAFWYFWLICSNLKYREGGGVDATANGLTVITNNIREDLS